MSARLPRAAYAAMFGPTTGDRIRLADTCLEIEVWRTGDSASRRPSDARSCAG